MTKPEQFRHALRTAEAIMDRWDLGDNIEHLLTIKGFTREEIEDLGREYNLTVHTPKTFTPNYYIIANNGGVSIIAQTNEYELETIIKEN